MPMPGPRRSSSTPTNPRPNPLAEIRILPSNHPNYVFAEAPEPVRQPVSQTRRNIGGAIVPELPWIDRQNEDEDLENAGHEDPFDEPVTNPVRTFPRPPMTGPYRPRPRPPLTPTQSNNSQTAALPNEDHLKGMAPEKLPVIQDESTFEEIKEEYR